MRAESRNKEVDEQKGFVARRQRYFWAEERDAAAAAAASSGARLIDCFLLLLLLLVYIHARVDASYRAFPLSFSLLSLSSSFALLSAVSSYAHAPSTRRPYYSDYTEMGGRTAELSSHCDESCSLLLHTRIYTCHPLCDVHIPIQPLAWSSPATSEFPILPLLGCRIICGATRAIIGQPRERDTHTDGVSPKDVLLRIFARACSSSSTFFSRS